jgi:hypothetical protein
MAEMTTDVNDKFYSVQLWSNPWPRRIKVIKMYCDQALNGIGWVSLNEYQTHKEAIDSARAARQLMRQGKSDDYLFAIFGDQPSRAKAIG